jgi:hypothetical protein
MKNFINHTNHPSNKWSAEQISAAKVFGEISDFPFPTVNPHATTEEIRKMVADNLKKIRELAPAAVLCQGEFNYTFEMVTQLKLLGIKVMAATSERVSVEEIQSDGSTRQISTFRFVRLREY